MRKCGRAMILILAVLTMTPVASAPAALGSAARKAAGELVEYLGKKFSREMAEEGGEAVVRKSAARVFARAGKSHGDDLVRLFRKLGPRSVRMADSYGDDAVRIMSRWGDNGVRLLGRSADDVLPLFRRYGDDALEVCIRHPGVGERLIGEMGEEGIEIGRKLTTDQVIQVLRASPELARQGKLREFGRLAAKSGREIFTFIERHPKLTLGVPAFIYIVNHPEILKPAGEAVGEGVGGAAGGIVEGVGRALMPEPEDRLIGMLIIGGAVVCTAGLFIFSRHRRKLHRGNSKAGEKGVIAS